MQQGRRKKYQGITWDNKTEGAQDSQCFLWKAALLLN